MSEFSDFFNYASDEEKEKVYMEVIDESIKRQIGMNTEAIRKESKTWISGSVKDQMHCFQYLMVALETIDAKDKEIERLKEMFSKLEDAAFIDAKEDLGLDINKP